MGQQALPHQPGGYAAAHYQQVGIVKMQHIDQAHRQGLDGILDNFPGQGVAAAGGGKDAFGGDFSGAASGQFGIGPRRGGPAAGNAGNGGAGGQGFQAALRAALALGGGVAALHYLMPDFGGHSVGPQEQPPPVNDPAANAGADGNINQGGGGILLPAGGQAGPIAIFPQGGQVGVIANLNGKGQSRRPVVFEGYAVQGRQIGRIQQRTGSGVHRPGHGNAQAGNSPAAAPIPSLFNQPGPGGQQLRPVGSRRIGLTGLPQDFPLPVHYRNTIPGAAPIHSQRHIRLLIHPGLLCLPAAKPGFAPLVYPIISAMGGIGNRDFAVGFRARD